MDWNWQKSDWPNFTWDASRLRKAEEHFLAGGGVVLGSMRHLEESQQETLTVAAISSEALTTSEIEGEILDRASVQSSVRKHLGLTADPRRLKAAEQGIGELMAVLYRSFSDPLSSDTLFSWHGMLLKGRQDLSAIGTFRTDEAPMQIVSGPSYAPRVHFEAPPASQVPAEMAHFIEWFNASSPQGREPLPALTRAGLSHLYFESIHPFEDGNGRMGRAISEKALAQTLGRPTLTAISSTILLRRKSYYGALQAANRSNEVTEWLCWFAAITLEAQKRTEERIEFLIEQTRLLDRLRGQLNERQEKVLRRIFREGPEGFHGGLSAGNYAAITGASQATVTRDLADLVEKGALERTGERRHTRYFVGIPSRVAQQARIDEAGNITWFAAGSS